MTAADSRPTAGPLQSPCPSCPFAYSSSVEKTHIVRGRAQDTRKTAGEPGHGWHRARRAETMPTGRAWEVEYADRAEDRTEADVRGPPARRPARIACAEAEQRNEGRPTPEQGPPRRCHPEGHRRTRKESKPSGLVLCIGVVLPDGPLREWAEPMLCDPRQAPVAYDMEL